MTTAAQATDGGPLNMDPKDKTQLSVDRIEEDSFSSDSEKNNAEKLIKAKSFVASRSQKETYKYEKWLIPETNMVKQFWDFYCMILVVYVCIVVPFRLAFDM